MRSDPSKGLEVHVDADFAGNYDHFDTANPDTAKSIHRRKLFANILLRMSKKF